MAKKTVLPQDSTLSGDSEQQDSTRFDDSEPSNPSPRKRRSTRAPKQEQEPVEEERMIIERPTRRSARSQNQEDTPVAEERMVIERPVSRSSRAKKQAEENVAEERMVIERPTKRSTRTKSQDAFPSSEEHLVVERPVKRSSRASVAKDTNEPDDRMVVEPAKKNARSEEKPGTSDAQTPSQKLDASHKTDDRMVDEPAQINARSEERTGTSDAQTPSQKLDASNGSKAAESNGQTISVESQASSGKTLVMGLYNPAMIKLKRPSGKRQAPVSEDVNTAKPTTPAPASPAAAASPAAPEQPRLIQPQRAAFLSNPSQQPANSVSQTDNKPQAFEPRTLSAPAPAPAPEPKQPDLRNTNIFWSIPESRFSLHLERRHSPVQRTLDQFRALIESHNGTVLAHRNNRPNILRDSATPGNRIRPEIKTIDFQAFTERLFNMALRMEMDIGLIRFSNPYSVVDWYGEVQPLPPVASAQVTESSQPAELRSAAKTAATASAPASAAVSDTTTAKADAQNDELTAVLNLFKTEVRPFHANYSQTNDLFNAHLSMHSERITTLMCDWARALPMIDAGVIDPKTGKPLLVLFMERFFQYLEIDTKAAEAQNVHLPDSIIQARFHLDNIDLLILWFLTALEIDPRFRQSLMATWNLSIQVYMSAGVLMRLMTMGARQRTDVISRVSPSSPMEFLGLFKIVQNSGPISPLYYEIVVSEQIVHMFSGTPSLSLLSRQFAEIQFPSLAPETYIAPENEKTLEIVKNYLERPPINSLKNLDRNNLDFVPSLGFLVEGLPGTGRCTLIKIIATKLNRPIIIVQSSPLPGIHPNDLELYLKSLFVDAMLMNAILCFRDTGTLFTDERISGYLARQLATRSVVCALCVDLAVKIPPVMEPYITFKTKMTANLKETASVYWKAHLSLPLATNSKVNVKELTEQLALQPFQIQKAAKLAYYSTDFNPTQLVSFNNDTLRKAAAVQVQKNIGSLAFVTDPEITLDDVIVSDDIMAKIKQIIGSAINRRRVLYEWGLSRRIRRGTGVIALFDGEPGTGKTHSAEAIAKSIGLSLMRVNIATMVDKYVGETEKNLTTIFEQARPDMQLLLFDEADSLFAKRTANVSKSNDRYSNMSVNVLLQLIERYEGVSVLTTNLKNALDPAFERRITYKIYFPMPKQPERERLWRYMCPPDILTSEPIDYEWLSELEMSGGEIKNAVLTAAFNAATMGVLLNSEILYNAGVAEASAAGRVLRRYEEGQDDFI